MRSDGGDSVGDWSIGEDEIVTLLQPSLWMRDYILLMLYINELAHVSAP